MKKRDQTSLESITFPDTVRPIPAFFIERDRFNANEIDEQQLDSQAIFRSIGRSARGIRPSERNSYNVRESVVASDPLQDVIKLLREVKAQVHEAADKKPFLKHAFLDEPDTANPQTKEQQDIMDLIHDIIETSFNVGHGNVNAARAQFIANSDKQAKELAPIIEEIKQSGKHSLREIAGTLNFRGIRTKNGNEWGPTSLQVVMKKIDKLKEQDAELGI